MRGIFEGDAIYNPESDHYYRIDDLTEIGNTIHAGAFPDQTAPSWSAFDMEYEIYDGDLLGNLRPMLVFRWNTPVLDLIQLAMDMTKSGLRITGDGKVQTVYLSAEHAVLDYMFGATGKIQPLSVLRQSEVVDLTKYS